MTAGLLARLAAATVAALVAVGTLAAAASVPAPQPVVTTETYAVHDGVALQADVCRLPDGVARRALVLVPGGGWAVGGRARFEQECLLGAQRGFVAVTIDYRLLPAVFPAQVQDVRAALSWVHAPATRARFSISADPMRLVGTSSGAVLVSQVLEGIGSGGRVPGAVDRAVLLSGIYDLDASAVPGNVRGEFGQYTGCGPVDCDRAETMSADAHERRLRASVLVVNGTGEIVSAGTAGAFVRGVRASGGSADLLVSPLSKHGLGVMRHDRIANRAIWAYLRA